MKEFELWFKEIDAARQRAGYEAWNARDKSIMWMAWEESRAALCVELPPENETGYITWTSAMRAIESAGVRCK